MIIKWWQGTDALKLYMYPPGKKNWKIRIFLHRIFWKLFHKNFEHWANTEKLVPYLNCIGINNVEIKPMPFNQTIYQKVKHNKFNVLFYIEKSKDGNQKYKDWIYGREIYNGLSDCDNFNVILIDGSADMNKIMPIVDLYVKVMKHHGSDKNRIAKECEINNIPVFYTDPQKTDNQNMKDIICKINQLISINKDI